VGFTFRARTLLGFVCAAVMAAFLVVAATGGPAAAAGDGVTIAAGNPYGYEYVNSATQKCLDLRDLYSGNGGWIQQWSCAGSQNQAWVDSNTASGVYSGKNPATGKCIDAYAGTHQQLRTWTCDGSASQNFKVHQSGSTFRFESVQYPGFCWDVFGSSSANGATVGLWECNGRSNQQWG